MPESSAPAQPDEFLALSTSRFDDVPRRADALPGWHLTYTQMSRGRYAGSIEEVRLRGMQLFRERTNVTTNQYGTGPRSRVTFGVSSARRGDAVINGTALPPAGLSMVRGDFEVNFTTPPTDMLVLSVDESMLGDYLQTTEHACLHALTRRGPLHLQMCDAFSRVGPALQSAHTELLARPTACAPPPGLLDTVRHDLLAQVAPIVAAHCVAPGPSLTLFSRSQIVKRAREYIMDRIEEPLQVIDLCREARVSRRALQNSFLSVVGTTPVNYLRLLRLSGARRDLLAGEGDSLQIKDVAERWGFWHLSRFSGEYRQMFGELPSETRRCARQVAAS